MLQIIGWLGCVYLIVKALSIAGSNDSYSPSKADPEKLEINSGAALACAIAWLAAAGFALWFLVQGAAGDANAIDGSGTTSYSDCVADAVTIEEINTCSDLLD